MQGFSSSTSRDGDFVQFAPLALQPGPALSPSPTPLNKLDERKPIADSSA